MEKETVGDYIAILAICEASGMEKWAYIDTDKCLKLPIFKMGLFGHPMVRAVKAAIKTFSDLKNIELSFELDGDKCNVKVYQTILKFEQSGFVLDKIDSPIKWYNPLVALAEGNLDNLSFQIVQLILDTRQKMKVANKNRRQDYNNIL